MQGKTVVITGATSGIGQVAAERLARQGARILMIARDAERARRAMARLATDHEQAHGVHIGDLSILAEMKRVAAEITAAEPRIDVLINNAGAVFNRRIVTVDGLELTFALNHMAYFVLTAGLLERLKATPGARIVSTSSQAHMGARLDFDDLQAGRAFSGFQVYGRSKLCNILFTRELARRLAGSGVSANCLHPGFVATRFGDGSGGIGQLVIGLAKLALAIPPERGAETIVHLAASPDVEGITGEYFFESKPAKPSPAARDAVAATRLWAASEAIASA